MILISLGPIFSHGQATTPFSCPSDFYQVINGELRPYNPANGTYGTAISILEVYNAGGYNTTDDYLYAIIEVGQPLAGHLIRIDSNGDFDDLGVLDTVGSGSYIAGDVDDSDNLYLRDGRGLRMIEDISTLPVAPLATVPTVFLGNASWTSNPGQMNPLDIVFINDVFYGVDESNLYKWDVGPLPAADGVRDIVSITNLPTTGSQNYGAVYTDNQDRLYVSNNDGGLYLIENYTGPSPNAVLLSSTDNVTRNDGFACASGSSAIDQDGDNGLDPFDLDLDGDGLRNIDEAPSDPFEDLDGDSVFAYLDDDDSVATGGSVGNANGIVEPSFDTDGDGIPDFFDLDSDNDGIYDVVEAGHNLPHTNGRITGQESGSGANGLFDGVETAPESGMLDYTIVNTTAGTPDFQSTDSDNDGCADAIEGAGSFTDSDITAGRLNGGVNGDGVPTIAGSPQNTAAVVTNSSDNSACTVADDGDGIPASVEDAGPNGGDGNGDGILDSTQANVTSIPDATGTTYVTLEVQIATTGDCTDISSVEIVSEASLDPLGDPSFNYPLGLVRFTLTCDNTNDDADVKFFWHGLDAVADVDAYRKYGPTTPTAGDDAFGVNTISFTQSSQSVGADLNVFTADYRIQDNQPGDSSNSGGSIIDPTGPAIAASTTGPTIDLDGIRAGNNYETNIQPVYFSIYSTSIQPTLTTVGNEIVSATIDFTGNVDQFELIYLASPQFTDGVPGADQEYRFSAPAETHTHTYSGFQITVSRTGASFTITSTAGGNIPNAIFEEFLQDFQYGNDNDGVNNFPTYTDGVRTMTVTITDTNTATASAQTTLRIFTTGPTVVDEGGTIAGNSTGTITGNVLTNDSGTSAITVSEVDVYPAAVGNTYTTLYGTVTIQSNGSYVYDVDENNTSVTGLRGGESLQDIISYTVEDAIGITDYGILTITIDGVDEAPDAVDNEDSLTAFVDFSAEGNIITDIGTNGVDAIDRGLSTLVWENEFVQGAFFTGLSNPIGGSSVVVDGVTLNFTSTDPSGFGFPNENQTVNLTATNGGHTGYLGYAIDGVTNPSDDTVLVIDFSEPVYNLGFLVVDIDFSQGTSWQDLIRIEGNLNGTDSNYKYVTTGGVVDAGNNTFYGIGSAVPSDATGNVNVFFEEPINQLRLSYNYGPNATDADQGGQIAGISDIYWQGGSSSITITEIDSSPVAATGSAFTGMYGTITVFPDGTYIYLPDTANPVVQTLLVGQTLTDTFNYTLSDGVSTDNADLIITINGSDIDSDGDGQSDRADLDDDNDGILDEVECGDLNVTGPIPIDISKIAVISGSASFDPTNDDTIELTPDGNSQAGTAMSTFQLDMRESFTLTYSLNFGTNNDSNLGDGDPFGGSGYNVGGADGIAFVLHNDPNGSATVGQAGAGIGASNIVNGLAIEFDTFDNGPFGADEGPVAGLPMQAGATRKFDHTSIWDTDAGTNPFGGSPGNPFDHIGDLPVTQVGPGGEVEDGAFHKIVVHWDATNQVLSWAVDDVFVGRFTDDIITNRLGGGNFAYVGVSASTGGLRNRHQITVDSFVGELNYCDTDMDGTPDYLDLDSDNDGCPDYVEGGGTFTVAADGQTAGGTLTDGNGGTVTTNLGNTIGSDPATDLGVPTVAGTGQTVGIAQDGTLELCTDSDGDTVPDAVDLDDDNDGILDTDECNFVTGDEWFDFVISYNPIGSNPVAVSDPTQALGPPNYDGDATDNPEQFVALGDVGSELSIGYSGAVLTNTGDASGDFQVTELGAAETSEVRLRPTAATAALLTAFTPDGDGYYSVGNFTGTTPLDIDAVFTGFAAGQLEFDAIRFIAINNAGAPNIGPDIDAVEALSYRVLAPVCADTDGDGLINSLDLDSDGDGCPDAQEGDGGFTSADLVAAGGTLQGGNSGGSYTGPSSTPVTDNLGNTVGTTAGVDLGVPTIATTGQGAGTSQDGIQENCTDSDGDLVPDITDLDDDNDGILDTDELCQYGPDDLVVDLNVILNRNIALSGGGVGTFGVTSITGGLEGYTFDDNLGGVTYYNITEWTGDLSASIGSFFRFGMAANDLGLTFYQDTQDVRIVGNGMTLSYDFNSGSFFDAYPNPADWNEVFDFDVQLTAANFGTDDATFNSVMSNLTMIQVRAEIWTGITAVETALVGADSTYSGGSPVRCDSSTDDFDNDGIPNNLDLDSDGDGCSDALEGGSLTIMPTDLATAGGTLQGGNSGGSYTGTSPDPITDNLGNTVGTTAGVDLGVPTIAGTGQTIGFTLDPTDFTSCGDDDNVDSDIEDAGPNGGDGNGDGTPDSSQTHVASIPDGSGNGSYVTIEVTGDCDQFSRVVIEQESEQSMEDLQYDYPFGLVDFTLQCGAVGQEATIKYYWHGINSLANIDAVRKFGPSTFGSPIFAYTSTIAGRTEAVETINGNPVYTTTYTIRDNALGDESTTDAEIVDPVGPAFSVDSDSDGIPDTVDLDDDNDGILDTDEADCGTAGNLLIIYDHNNGTGATNDTNATVTASSFVASGSQETVGAGLTLEPRQSGQTFLQLIGVDQTTFAGAVTNADYVQFDFTTSTTSPGGILNNFTHNILTPPIVPAQQFEHKLAIVIATQSDFSDRVTLKEDFIPGTTPTFIIEPLTRYILEPSTQYFVRVYLYDAPVSASNTASFDDFGFQIDTCSIAIDADGDGIPNMFDLDSDNDGCPDALEGDGGLTYTSLNSDGSINTATNPVNNNGIPVGPGTAGNGTTGQNSVSATDNAVTAAICDPCNPANPDFTDADSDGIADLCDEDDDNDGILDTDECVINFITIRPFDDLGIPDTSLNNTITDVDVSTRLGLPAGSVLISATGLNRPDANPNLFVGDTFAGTPSTFTITGTAASRVRARLEHGGVIQTGGRTDVVESLDGTPYEFTTTLTGDFTNISLPPRYEILNITATNSNNGSRFTWESTRAGVTNFSFSSNDTGDDSAIFLALSVDPDFDGDGLADCFDLDSDNDGIYDVVEANGADANNDGIADGIVDSVTGIPSSAGSGLSIPDTDATDRGNPYDLDSDDDGCSDSNEYYNSATADGGGGQFGNGTTDPAPINANGTVIAAVYSGTAADTDSNSVADYVEGSAGAPLPNPDGDALANACDDDDDNDGNVDTTDTTNPITPQAVDDTGSATAGAVATIPILTNDDFTDNTDGNGDPDNGNPASITTLTTVPGANTTAGGIIEYDPATGELDYIPLASEGGTTVTIEYEVCNDITGDGATADDICSRAIVSITVAFGDTDGDGVLDNADICPGSDDTLDSDSDGIPNGCDDDDDNDGIVDTDEIACNTVTSSTFTLGWDPNLISGAGGSSNSGNTGVEKINRYEANLVDATRYQLNTLPATIGSGFTDESDITNVANFVDGHGYFFVSGADAPDAATAATNGDYIEFSFTSLDNQANIITAISFHDVTTFINGTYSATRGVNISTDAIRPIYADYSYQVIISDDNFVTSDVLVPTTVTTRQTSGNFTNTGPFDAQHDEFVPLPTNYQLAPSTNYKIRLLLFASEDTTSGNSFVTLDNFVVFSGLCSDLDSDGDSIPNNLDLDSDNDGIYDVVEANGADVNNDGIADGVPNITTGIPSSATTGLTVPNTDAASDGANPYDLDSDDDGCSDSNEYYNDTNADGGGGQYGNGTTDPAPANANGTVVAATYPATAADTDSNSIADYVEGTAGAPLPNPDGDTLANACDEDDDNDGNPDTTDTTTPNSPTATDDSASATAGVSTIIPILTNDDFTDNTDGNTDPDNINPASVTTITTVAGANTTAGGLITYDPATGELDYTPLASEGGTTVTIEYEVCNDITGDGATADDVCSTAIVTITVAIGDSDGDGVLDNVDICPGGNDAADNDADGIPDFCDLDDDNDGIADLDECPLNYININATLLGIGGAPFTNASVTNVDVSDSFGFPANSGAVIISATGLNSDNGSRLVVGAGYAPNDISTFTITGSAVPRIRSEVEHGRTLGVDQFDGLESLDGTLYNLISTLDANFREANFPPVYQVQNTTGTANTVSFVWTSASAGVSNLSLYSTNSGTSSVIRLRLSLDSDFDGDGLADCIDLDSDNDGIYDVVEANGADVNNDGIADGVVAANGIPGSAGTGLTIPDTDGTDRGNPYDLDSDDDGCSDSNEYYNDTNADGGGGQYASGTTDPAPINANGTVIAATYPATASDTDSNSVADYVEGTAGAPLPNPDGDTLANACDEDDDNDGNPDTTDTTNPITPVAVDDTASATAEVLTTIPILTNDDFTDNTDGNTDPDNVNPASVTTITTVAGANTTAQGSILYNADTGELNYIPLSSEGGTTVTIEYEVCNDITGDGATADDVCSTAIVTITVAVGDYDGDGVLDNVDICPGGDDSADVDGDGIPDFCDQDDDNDGILDTVEDTCDTLEALLPAPSNNIAVWEHQNDPVDYAVPVNIGTAYVSSAGSQILGSGLTDIVTAAERGFGYITFSGVDQPDLASAKTDNDYLEYSFVGGSDRWVLSRLFAFDTPTVPVTNGEPAFNGYDITVEVSTDNFATSTEIFTDTDNPRDGTVGHAGANYFSASLNTIPNPVFVEPGVFYKVRVYFYANDALNSGQATWDNFTLAGRLCLDDNDFDNDGIVNSLDLDSDNDGIYDVVEADGTDVNNDGIADGVPNTTTGIPGSAVAGLTVPNTDGATDGGNPYDLDSDDDGCSDSNEYYNDTNADGGGGQYGNGTTDPAPTNTNGTVIAAPYSATAADTDSNNVADYVEGTAGAPLPNPDGDTLANACDEDDDNDGNPDTTDTTNPTTPVAVDDSASATAGVLATVPILTNDDFTDNTDGNSDPDNIDPASVTTITTVLGANTTAGGTITYDPSTGELNYVPLLSEGGTTVTIEYEVCNDITGNGATADDVCDTAIATITVAFGDSDGDGVLDNVDICPEGDDNADADGDGVPDFCDQDDDNDGIADSEECPTEYVDTSGTGALMPGSADVTFNSYIGGVALDSDVTLTNFTYVGGATDTEIFGQTNGYLRFQNPSGFNIGEGISVDANLSSPEIVTLEANTANIDPTAINQSDTFTFEAIGASGAFAWVIENNSNGIITTSGSTITITGAASSGIGGLTPFVDFRITTNEPVSSIRMTHVSNTSNVTSVNTSRVAIFVCRDTDNDGIANSLDIDSDNDGIYDVVEANGTDVNNDGIADGVPNSITGIPSSAGTGLTVPNTDGTADGGNPYDLDSDDDGCSDSNEYYDDANADGGGGQYGNGTTDPAPTNTNGTVIAAPYSATAADTDSNSVADYVEGTAGAPLPNPDGDTLANACDEDDDNDGNPDTTDTTNPTTPVAVDDTIPGTQPVGTPVTFNVLANDDFTDNTDGNGDPDNVDPASVTTITTVVGANTTATGTINYNPATGEIEYTPAPLEDGVVTIEYEVCNDITGDGATADDVCATAIVTLTVEGTDTDDDGIPDVTDVDDDNDGIADVDENSLLDGGGNPVDPSADADGDGIPNYLDTDAPDGSGTLPDGNSD
ncbi:lectin-like domain-containing protein, partial [Tenacibaculum agarivorans]|uniref:lectin-like domain-containing protein n=1 Tax=Tenacibaculum agarivorans TaxID=1908389 RepID=UPI0013562B25